MHDFWAIIFDTYQKNLKKEKFIFTELDKI